MLTVGQMREIQYGKMISCICKTDEGRSFGSCPHPFQPVDKPMRESLDTQGESEERGRGAPFLRSIIAKRELFHKVPVLIAAVRPGHSYSTVAGGLEVMS